ncbi:MAG: glycosyltransferase family 4 protein [Oscillospiraceae bacterium]|nr:glycosyltransferase family 4 protein [Oscillospiraceae bacterium]
MRILVVSPKNKTVFNFRGDLIKDMIAKGHEVLVVGPNQDYVDDVLALGVSEFIEIPMVKDNTSVSNDLSYLLALRRLMKEKKPDLVFGYTIKPVIYGSIAAKMAGVKHIHAMVTGLGRVYASSGMKAKAVRTVTKLLYKRAFKACDSVIFQNGDDIKQLVEEHYLPLDKTVQVNGSGVNMERFARTPLPEKPVFLMVSRVIREKGVMEYCQAARQVKKACPEARCILLGGYDRSIGALKEEDIAPYIQDGSIEFPGEVKDPVAFYGQASVFVLPSYYREGLPRTLLEALSCGRPIITTDWPGCREPVEDGKNGYMIPVKDAELLADRMLTLTKDRALLLSMSDAAYETCKTRFEVGIINDQMRRALGY